MPSTKVPRLVVYPGPGEPVPGPGGGPTPQGVLVALQQHVANPFDAHMSTAIGIPPYDLSAWHLLKSAGGPIDGESVLDYIVQAVDLFPLVPWGLGFNGTTLPNSGIPSWGKMDPVGTGIGTARSGAWTSLTNVVTSTRTILPAVPTALYIEGTVAPADRGVLALYRSPSSDYYYGGDVTLEAALYLNRRGYGMNPPGIPNADFSVSNRHGRQSNYTASNVDLDWFSLTSRSPYSQDYAALALSSIYGDYNADFSSYQLARVTLNKPYSLSTEAGGWLLVHWTEEYATSLATIQPSQLATNLATHAYSATPSWPYYDFDHGDVTNVDRNRVYCCPSPPVVTLTTLTADQNVASFNTVILSGVYYIAASLTPLFDFDIRSTGLMDSPYYQSEFMDGSSFNPMALDWSGFGDVGYGDPIGWSDCKPLGGSFNYSNSHPPHDGDVAQYLYTGRFIPGTPTLFAGPKSGSYFSVSQRRPFVADVVSTSSVRFLFNSYPQTGPSTLSTLTKECFVDERFRCTLASGLGFSGAFRVDPTFVYKYGSTLILGTITRDLQVGGGELFWPQYNYTSVNFRPTGLNPNYLNIRTADLAATPCLRRYLRAFDTGRPLDQGRIKISGLDLSLFQAVDNANPYTAHPGCASIELYVPTPGGATPSSRGSFDLGRPIDAYANVRGCMTDVEVGDDYVIVSYSLRGVYLTEDNGFGEFPLLVLVTFYQPSAGPTGVTLSLTQLEWLPPIS